MEIVGKIAEEGQGPPWDLQPMDRKPKNISGFKMFSQYSFDFSYLKN